jgi:hypothetical protein
MRRSILAALLLLGLPGLAAAQAPVAADAYTATGAPNTN